MQRLPITPPKHANGHIFKVHSVHAGQKGDGREDGGNHRQDEQDALLTLVVHRLHQAVHVAAAVGAVLDVIQQLLNVVLHVVEIDGHAMGAGRVRLERFDDPQDGLDLHTHSNRHSPPDSGRRPARATTAPTMYQIQDNPQPGTPPWRQ